MNEDWKRLEHDQVALGAYFPIDSVWPHILYGECTRDIRMKDGPENGDTDWYDPNTLSPGRGEPVYLKMEVTFKAWHLPDCKLATWILEPDDEIRGKILAWQKREDGKNYYHKDEGSECNNT